MTPAVAVGSFWHRISLTEPSSKGMRCMRAVHAVAFALAMNIVVSAQQIAPVHVLKISSGATGSETNGVFTLTDERSVFNRTTDREVIIR